MPNMLLQAMCGTLDQLSAGFVAAFPDGRILHANRAAHEMMNAGWPIRSQDGFLQGDSRKTTGILLKNLRQAADFATISPSDSGCLDICLASISSPPGAAIASMRPLVKKDGGTECVVALFVQEIKSPSDCALSGIAKCFGLTPAETRTLHRFVEGGAVAGVAQALAISENTVKTHLQNIFAKTRSSRQQQLVKLVNDLTPPCAPVGAAKTMPAAASCTSAVPRRDAASF